MKKRGVARAVTNIEMIIAMTLFIFSIVLIVYYINFIGIEREPSDVLLNILEKNIRKEAEISYNSIYLTINYSNPAQCFNITKHSTIIEENKTFVERRISFEIDDDWLLINNSDEKKYVIYTFPFNVTVPYSISLQNCVPLEKEDYNYSIPFEDKIFVYENLTRLLSKSYEDLKNEWNFKDDFSINLSVTGQSLSMGGIKPLQAAIRARQFSIKTINKTGDTFDGIVNIQVW